MAKQKAARKAFASAVSMVGWMAASKDDQWALLLVVLMVAWMVVLSADQMAVYLVARWATNWAEMKVYLWAELWAV